MVPGDGKRDAGAHTVETLIVVAELPHGKEVGSRWVLPFKSHNDGQTTKTKARLVVKGFMQSEGLDYLRMSAPTPAAASVKICGGCCR